MHCPSCGQQQISNETKFCSRCGLPLGIVSEVLVYGGYLPQLAELNKRKPALFSRRNGLAFSLIWCLFFLLIMAPLWGILDLDKLAGASAVIGIFGGLILMISSLIFLRREPQFAGDQRMYPQGQYELPGQSGYSALPPQQSVPASVYSAPTTGSWRDTNDLQPTSVTEGTTKLLEKDEQ
jgi:hypothetical protein